MTYPWRGYSAPKGTSVTRLGLYNRASPSCMRDGHRGRERKTQIYLYTRSFIFFIVFIPIAGIIQLKEQLVRLVPRYIERVTCRSRGFTSSRGP